MQKVSRPIFIKLTVFTMTILMVVVSILGYTNSRYFKESSIQKEETSNLLFATSKSKEVESLVAGYIEKIRFYSLFLLQSSQDDNWKQVFNKSFKEDHDIVSVAIKRKVEGKITGVRDIQKTDIFKKYEVNSDYLKNYISLNKISFDSNFNGDVSVQNISFNHKLPLLHISVPLLRNKRGEYIFIASAVVRIENLVKIFSSTNKEGSYLIDNNGVYLTHTNESLILSKEKIKEQSILDKTKDKLFRDGQFELIKNNNELIVALSKNKYGLTSVIETKKSVITLPANFTIKQTFYIAGIILALSTFFIFMLSNNFTVPIEKLVNFAHEIAKGNFEVEAENEIQTKDELQVLAHAFDDMTSGLKERDKIKTMFSKFHGSSITEDILQSSLNREGTKKEAVVYFSDIRGFTAFSESKPPEEVVEMLNEYFQTMVTIINKHGGVVDKFIGDAIMALWGIPKPTDQFKVDAVTAALNMRKALVPFNEKRVAEGKEEIMIGAGLHIGHVISGTIGSDERMEYTAIGDTVNTAARIEASTKSFGTDLLISHELMEVVQDHFVIEKAGVVEAKGKSEGVALYKVRGFKHADGTEEIITTKFSDYEAGKDAKIKIAS